MHVRPIKRTGGFAVSQGEQKPFQGTSSANGSHWPVDFREDGREVNGDDVALMQEVSLCHTQIQDTA